MTPKAKSVIYTLSKVVELSLLGYGAYYAATKGAQAEPLVFIGLYSVLLSLAVIEYFFVKLNKHNMALLVKHFYEQCGFDKESDVKITIHRRLKINKEKYEQYIDYHPHGTKRGRKHPVGKGIVRKAFTASMGEFTENFSDKQDKLTRLKQDYNYNDDEAREKLNDEEVSYYCCPIMDDGKVWGVLYLNAKTYGTFPDQANVSSSDFSKRVKTLLRFLEDEIS